MSNRVIGHVLKTGVYQAAFKQARALGQPIRKGGFSTMFGSKGASASWTQRMIRNPETGEIAEHAVEARIAYPKVPDNASLSRREADLFAGFTLHEVGHIAYTNFKAPQEAGIMPSSLEFHLYNGIEDARMENSVIQSGKARGARSLFKRVLVHLISGMDASWNPCDINHAPFALALICRAALGNGNNFAANLLKRIPEPKRSVYQAAADAMAGMALDRSGSAQACEAALAFIKAWKALEQQQQQEQDDNVMINPGPGGSGEQGDIMDSGDLPEQKDDFNDKPAPQPGTGQPKPRDPADDFHSRKSGEQEGEGEPKSGTGKPKSGAADDEEDRGSLDDGESVDDPLDGEDVDDDVDYRGSTSDDPDDFDDDGEDAGEGEGDDGEEGIEDGDFPAPGEDGGDFPAGEGEGDDADDSDDSEAGMGAGVGAGFPDKTEEFDPAKCKSPEPDLTGISKRINKRTIKPMHLPNFNPAQRSAFSEFWKQDQIGSNEEAHLAMMESAPGALRAQIARLLRAPERRGWDGGAYAGRFDIKKQSRMFSGSESVFKKRWETEGVNTALEIIIDMSGSMDENAKIAFPAAYAIALAAEAAGCKVQISGFSSWHGRRAAPARMQHQANGNAEISTKLQVYEGGGLVMFKTWNQKCRAVAAQVKKGMQMIAGGTPDYPCIRTVAEELAHRPEKRRIVLVLTDGMGYVDEMAQYTRAAPKLIGVEIIGIAIGMKEPEGVQDDSWVWAFDKAYDIGAYCPDVQHLATVALKQLIKAAERSLIGRRTM